jgi:hypothetical protein
VVVPNVRRGVWWGASFVGYALHIERGVCGVCAHIYVCMWVWCVLPRSLGVCVPLRGRYRKVPSQGVAAPNVRQGVWWGASFAGECTVSMYSS